MPSPIQAEVWTLSVCRVCWLTEVENLTVVRVLGAGPVRPAASGVKHGQQ